MLRKLLKYDFRAVFKTWLIGLVVVLGLSVVGGFGIQILESPRKFNEILQLLAGLSVGFSIFALAAFFLMTEIILAVRFYKNFFTDEGYLTFTLPVKLHTLINAKLILSMVMMILTTISAIVGGCILLAMSKTIDLSLLAPLWKTIFSNGWVILYMFEGLVILFLSTLFGILFLGCCITFGSVIVKKGKALAAFGVYYAANSIFSIVFSVFSVFGIPSLAMWLLRPEFLEKILGGVALLLLGGIGFMGLLCSLLYELQYRLLDRKLNLP